MGLAGARQHQGPKDLIGLWGRDPNTVAPSVHTVLNSHALLRCHPQLCAVIGVQAHPAPLTAP
eukprot:6653485-Alexandrium_andersonii.AAC.1